MFKDILKYLFRFESSVRVMIVECSRKIDKWRGQRGRRGAKRMYPKVLLDNGSFITSSGVARGEARVFGPWQRTRTPPPNDRTRCTIF